MGEPGFLVWQSIYYGTGKSLTLANKAVAAPQSNLNSQPTSWPALQLKPFFHELF